MDWKVFQMWFPKSLWFNYKTRCTTNERGWQWKWTFGLETKSKDTLTPCYWNKLTWKKTPPSTSAASKCSASLCSVIWTSSVCGALSSIWSSIKVPRDDLSTFLFPLCAYWEPLPPKHYWTFISRPEHVIKLFVPDLSKSLNCIHPSINEFFIK